MLQAGRQWWDQRTEAVRESSHWQFAALAKANTFRGRRCFNCKQRTSLNPLAMMPACGVAFLFCSAVHDLPVQFAAPEATDASDEQGHHSAYLTVYSDIYLHCSTVYCWLQRHMMQPVIQSRHPCMPTAHVLLVWLCHNLPL